MAQETLSDRVRRLERRVEMLETLPQRMDAVESQILQLRGEVGVIRTEMHNLNAETIRVVETLHEQAQRHADTLHEDAKRYADTLHQQAKRHTEPLMADTRSHMLVLHEEIIDRLKRLSEGGR